MEISTALEATCPSALPPVVNSLPFVDAPLVADAPLAVGAPSTAAAAAAAALGNGVTIPLTAAAGMMKLKVMGRVNAGERVSIGVRARRWPFVGLQ